MVIELKHSIISKIAGWLTGIDWQAPFMTDADARVLEHTYGVVSDITTVAAIVLAGICVITLIILIRKLIKTISEQ